MIEFEKNGFFENGENFAADVCAKLQFVFNIGRVELEFNAARAKNVSRKTPHSLHEVAQIVFARIDRPHDISHRVDEFDRGFGGFFERRGERVGFGVARLTSCNLR